MIVTSPVDPFTLRTPLLPPSCARGTPFTFIVPVAIAVASAVAFVSSVVTRAVRLVSVTDELTTTFVFVAQSAGLERPANKRASKIYFFM